TPVLRIRTDAHKTARALRDFDGSNVCVASRPSTNMWLAPGGADFQFCSYVFSNCNLQSVRAARCLCWNVSLLRRCFPLGSPQARGLVFRVDCQLCSSGLSLCRLSRTVAAKRCHTYSCFWGWCWLRPGMVLAFALAYHLAPQNYLGARSVHVPLLGHCCCRQSATPCRSTVCAAPPPA